MSKTNSLNGLSHCTLFWYNDLRRLIRLNCTPKAFGARDSSDVASAASHNSTFDLAIKYFHAFSPQTKITMKTFFALFFAAASVDAHVVGKTSKSELTGERYPSLSYSFEDFGGKSGKAGRYLIDVDQLETRYVKKRS